MPSLKPNAILAGLRSWRPASGRQENLAAVLESALASKAMQRIALAIVIALAAFSAATLTWRMVAPAAPSTPPVRPFVENAAARADVSGIFTARLFGDTTVPPLRRAGSGPAISDLGVTLIGVVSAGKDSVALISLAGRAPEPFVIGQAVTGGATLETVTPDRITLRRNGRSEIVMLVGAPVAPASQGLSNSIRSTGPDRYSVSRESVRAELASPEVLMQASVSPVSGGGLQIGGVQTGSVYERLGLKTGTVIKSINGTALTSSQDLLSLYQKIGTSNDIQLDVVIDGRPTRLQYDVR